MARYRVQVELTTSVLHYVTVEAEDEAAAGVAGALLVEEIDQEGTGDGPDGSDYHEGGIGGETSVLSVGRVDGTETDPRWVKVEGSLAEAIEKGIFAARGERQD